ncbi:Uncharacterised protein [uncultured Blautia sp.]|nr:Uncharacterised protein [uncultured Blautia sp.]
MVLGHILPQKAGGAPSLLEIPVHREVEGGAVRAVVPLLGTGSSENGVLHREDKVAAG